MGQGLPRRPTRTRTFPIPSRASRCGSASRAPPPSPPPPSASRISPIIYNTCQTGLSYVFVCLCVCVVSCCRCRWVGAAADWCVCVCLCVCVCVCVCVSQMVGGQVLRHWCYLDAQASHETADAMRTPYGAVQYMRSRMRAPSPPLDPRIRHRLYSPPSAPPSTSLPPAPCAAAGEGTEGGGGAHGGGGVLISVRDTHLLVEDAVAQVALPPPASLRSGMRDMKVKQTCTTSSTTNTIQTEGAWPQQQHHHHVTSSSSNTNMDGAWRYPTHPFPPCHAIHRHAAGRPHVMWCRTLWVWVWVYLMHT